MKGGAAHWGQEIGGKGTPITPTITVVPITVTVTTPIAGSTKATVKPVKGGGLFGSKAPFPTHTPAAKKSSAPKYVNCAGNQWNGACPAESVCVGDPRSRGLTLDAICVPTIKPCGGKVNQICDTGSICVPDPRETSW